MIDIEKCINVYSEMNDQIDFCIVVKFLSDFGIACKVIKAAYDEWFESDTCEAIADYISRCLLEKGIEHDIYLKEVEEE